MSEANEVNGTLDAKGRRFALIVARHNQLIGAQLLCGAMDAIVRHGGDPGAVTIYRVPGGFELPLVAKKVAERGGVDAIVALGAVIRGSTPHFDYVAAECNRGLCRVALDSGIPVTIGVLTTDTIEQAIERAGTKAGNKGWDAACAAIEMADLMSRL